jgi:hypothetical protein
MVVEGNTVTIPIKEIGEGDQGMEILERVLVVREEYMAQYPGSDLARVMAGAKTFEEALLDASEH